MAAFEDPLPVKRPRLRYTREEFVARLMAALGTIKFYVPRP